MKIVLVSFSKLPTLQNYLFNTYEHMSELGQNVYTINSDEINVPFTLSEKNMTINVPNSPLPTPSSLKKMMGTVKEIVGRIVELNPDVVHFISKHTWNYPIIRKLKKKTNIKIVHTFHDPIGHKGDLVRYGVIMYNKLIGRSAHAVVVHSGKSFDETVEKLKPRAKVFTAPLGCTKWRPYKETEATQKRLLIFGRINNYKGCDMIPAIAEEVAKIDWEIKIVVAGKASKDVKQTTLDAISACSNIEFTQGLIPEEEIDDYFYNCDAVLITHTSMTQSGVVLDAYSHSKPIVSFEIEGIAEFLSERSLCAPAFDIVEYARKACELTRDSEHLKKISKQAWEFGKNNFASENMAREFLTIYNNIHS